MTDVLIIGGGAAGLTAAVFCAKRGKSVTLFERNDILGKKLLITGKGRCNLTNNCDNETFLSNVVTNPKFLYSAIGAFSTKDTIEFFESLGVPLKTERGQRVFPNSDKSCDIVNALKKEINKLNVKVINKRVKDIKTDNGAVSGVLTYNKEFYQSQKVILCTGGVSYPATGSNGDGYEMAKRIGHKIIAPKGALVPLQTVEDCSSLMGLTLKNVKATLKLKESGKKVFEDFGEMLFTHFGLSGPIILSLSSHIKDMKEGKYKIAVDLKSALSHTQLDARILRDFSENTNKELKNALNKLLPTSLIPFVILKSGIDPNLKVNSITKEQRKDLVNTLKELEFDIAKFRPIEEAIITSGGVCVNEINPKTMESKLVKGLYFAGEIIDTDAYTGGFNLQIAFSSGYLAANNV